MELSKISFKAIFLGSLSGWIFLSFSMCMGMGLTGGPIPGWNVFMPMIFSAPAYIVSCYIAASITENNIRRHVIFVCILNMIAGLYIYYTLASAINGVWQIEAIPVLIVTAIASSMLGAHLSQKKLKITTRAGNKSVPGYCRFFNARNKRREWRILLVIICMSLSLLAFIIIGYLVSEFQFIWVLTPICFWLLMKEAHERSLTEAAAMGKRKQSAWPLATIFIISLFLVSLLFLDLSSFVSQPIEGAFHAPTIAP